MSASPTRFYFDFLDPLSFLVGKELDRLAGAEVEGLAWIGVEVRPPPTPLTTQDDSQLAGRWAEAREIARTVGLDFAPPDLVPWTRKAHELLHYAAAQGREAAVRTGIFEAYLLEGLDIGRIDVLVRVAREAGLDSTECKAVLDVDRFEAAVVGAANHAASSGIVDVPTIVGESGRLEGFHNHVGLGTFLRR